MTDDICQFLAWDSQFFGVRIARVNASVADDSGIRSILDWCHANRVGCLYFLVDPSNMDTVWRAESNGFLLMDVRMDLSLRLHEWRIPDREQQAVTSDVSPALKEELPELKRIARVCYDATRFCVDPGLRDRAPALYERWITRSCEESSDTVLVARLDGKPVGYMDCAFNAAAAEGQIGLVGVDPSSRRKGVGSALLAETLGRMQAQGAREVNVVTQGPNQAALGLYYRAGFLPRSVGLWYHKWFCDYPV